MAARVAATMPSAYRTPSGTARVPPWVIIPANVTRSSSTCMDASKSIAPNAQLNRMITGRGNSGEKTEPDESLLQLGREEEIQALQRLDRQARLLEKTADGPS